MTKPLFANNATASVTAITGTAAPAPGTSQTFTVGSIVSMPTAVTGVSTFSFADPAQPTELMTATNTSGGTWTVTRGAEGTPTVVHASPFTIYKITSAGDLGSLLPLAGGTMSGPSRWAARDHGLANGSGRRTRPRSASSVGQQPSRDRLGRHRVRHQELRGPDHRPVRGRG